MMKEKGDFLVIMREQEKTQMKKCIETETQWHYWAIQLAFKNFAIVAAYMIVLEHVECDITCLDDTISLLSPNTDRFLLYNTFLQCDSAYLYFDTNLCAFVRSGKVTGCGFRARHKEHDKKSKREMQPASFTFCIHAKR
jgi:hypothetical protein